MVTQTAEDTAVSRIVSAGAGVDAGTQAQETERENRQWTIKGLDPSTIEVTREAARRSGMKLNSFVSQALSRAAAASELRGTDAPSIGAPIDDLKMIKDELAKIREQGQQLERLESTINSMSAILLKICADKL